MVAELRDIAIKQNNIKNHNRTPEIFANLIAGAFQFYEWLADVKLIDTHTKELRRDAIAQGLLTAFKTQAIYQHEGDEVETFADLLRSVLSSHNGHIALAVNQGVPSNEPYKFGWTRNHESGEHKQNGDCFGWHWHKDGKDGQIWLDKRTAYRLISEFARKAGEPFLMSSNTLWRRLDDRGLLLVTEKGKDGTGKLDVKRLIAGYSKRVLVIAEDWLLPPPEHTTSPENEKS